MRKYLVIALALTFMLFTVGLMAQTTGSSGSMSDQQSGSTSSQNPSSPSASSSSSTSQETPSSSSQSGSMSNPQSSTSDQSPSGSQTGAVGSSQGTATSGSMGTSSEPGRARSVEGCVVREQTDYFLVPRSGNPIHLSASAGESLDKYNGQHVKVKGTETAWAGASGGAMSAGAAGTSGTATGTTGSSTPPSSQSGAIGSTAGSQAGAAPSGQMGTSGSMDNRFRQAATQELLIDKVSTVAATCPANWNSAFSTTGSSQEKSPESQKY